MVLIKAIKNTAVALPAMGTHLVWFGKEKERSLKAWRRHAASVVASSDGWLQPVMWNELNKEQKQSVKNGGGRRMGRVVCTEDKDEIKGNAEE